MKRKVILAGSLILSACLFGACGMLGGGSNSLTLKTEKGEAQTFDVKAGRFTVQKDVAGSGPVTEFLICVANREDAIPADVKRYDLLSDVKKEGNIKVCFDINGPEGYDENAQVKTGTFPVHGFSGGYKPDTAGYYPKIYLFKDGKSDRAEFNVSRTKGHIEITSASADQISGTVDLTDGKNEIKGGFTAEKVKEK